MGDYNEFNKFCIYRTFSYSCIFKGKTNIWAIYPNGFDYISDRYSAAWVIE